MFIFVIILLIVLTMRENTINRQNREIKELSRKLDVLLRNMDIPPEEIPWAEPIRELTEQVNLLLINKNIAPSDAASPEPIYKKITELLSEGKKKEAKDLAKKELLDPAECRGAGLR